MGYFPDTINYQCEAPIHIKKRGTKCVSPLGIVIHEWHIGVGCLGCEYFLDKPMEDDSEDGER